MVPALLVTLFLTLALWFWARWLGRLYGVPRFVRHLGWPFLLGWAVGAVGSLHGLISSFGAVGGESVDPSQKARILAEGISEAMNLFALSLVSLVFFALVMLILTWRYRWSKKPEEPRGDPPYR